MITMGIDIGSSSVKVSLLDTTSGMCLSSYTSPKEELPITSKKKGWAEQSPHMWWEHVTIATRGAIKESEIDATQIAAIGITYQMHGLVIVDAEGNPLRDSIIWCDSRAVEIGQKAAEKIGHKHVLENMLNSPGNFTASKLSWVKENEPLIFDKTYKFMLPGDYIAYKLTGEFSTTKSGLSEGIMWNFKNEEISSEVMNHYGIPKEMVPTVYDSIEHQCNVSAEAATELGLKEGTPICYRAGDQPNNAFSLNVLQDGEIAATGGTSGVVYGVTNKRKADLLSRVNTFLHVNHTSKEPSYGVLLCINGAGILNAWMRKNIAADLNYDQINELCNSVEAGSDGVSVLPFGNGSERMLENRSTGVTIENIDLNRHSRANVLRAAQEGIAFAFKYGIDIMKESGINPKVIKAGQANLFLSPIFRKTLATISNCTIELYNTDGALGAARGAALGAGFYKTPQEAFTTLKKVAVIEPDNKWSEPLNEAYNNWKKLLSTKR